MPHSQRFTNHNNDLTLQLAQSVNQNVESFKLDEPVLVHDSQTVLFQSREKKQWSESINVFTYNTIKDIQMLI